MNLIARYGIGPHYGTDELVNEVRCVYQHGGATVWVDLPWQRHRAEVFAFVGDGPLWCLGVFRAPSRADAERRAQGLVEQWINTQ